VLLRKAGIVIPSVSCLSCAYCSSLGPVLAKTGIPGFWCVSPLPQYCGTALKGHPWNEDTSLIRTLDQIPTLYKYVLFSPWNEDTPLIRTHFRGPRVSVLEGSQCISWVLPSSGLYWHNSLPRPGEDNFIHSSQLSFLGGGRLNKQGGCVTLMWLVALSSGLAVLWCGRVVLRRILLGVKKKNKELIKPIECSNELQWVSVFVGLLKGPKSRLESGWHPRVPWPRYSGKLIFQHSRPRPFSC